MKLLFRELGLTLEVVGAGRPGHPPWRIANPHPAGKVGHLTRRRFPTVEALSEAVFRHCAA